MKSKIYKPALLLLIANGAMVLYSLSGLGYNLFDYLVGPAQRFDDFYNCFTMGNGLFKPNGVFVLAPILALIVPRIAHLNHDVLFILSNIFYVGGSVYFLNKCLSNKKVILLLPLLYPFYFLFSRANNDEYTFVFFLMFLYLFRESKFSLASLALGFLAALKPPLLALVIMFVPVRRYKEVVATGMVFGVVFLGPLFFLKGGFEVQYGYFRETIQNYYRLYVQGDGGFLHGSSIYGMVKTLVYIWKEPSFNINPAFLPYAREYMASLYGTLSLVAMGISFGYATLAKMSLEDRVLLIVCTIIVFPHVSADYRLIFLVPSFLMALVGSLERGKTDVRLLLLGLLMIPKGYMFFTFSHTPEPATLNSVLNPLILIGVMVSIFWTTGPENFSRWKAKLVR